MIRDTKLGSQAPGSMAPAFPGLCGVGVPPPVLVLHCLPESFEHGALNPHCVGGHQGCWPERLAHSTCLQPNLNSGGSQVPLTPRESSP